MKLTRPGFLFAAYSVILAIGGWNILTSLLSYASDLEHKNASQVFLIPFVSGALIFLNRRKIFASLRYALFPGALVILAGFAMILVSGALGPRLNAGDLLSLQVASLVVLWLGGFLLFFGTQSFRDGLFPLLFLVFCIPIPELIMNPLVGLLQRGSAEMSFVLLKLSGTPVYRQGFFFSLPNMVIEIAPECSGIRSFISMLILSILGGHLLLQTTWKKVALILVAVPVMIFKNAVRIGTLSFLAVHVNPGILESRLHREGGIPFFLLALALIYPVLTLLMRSERNDLPGRAVLKEV